MNLQRREEIRELIAEIARYEELGATLDLESKAHDAITELLAHIDTLEQTAAERVIARGAAVKPHTFGEIVNQVRDIAIQYAGTEQLRERIAHALAPHFERDAGPTPDYTGEGSAWVPPAEAQAVVVPELTDAMVDLAIGPTLASIDAPGAQIRSAKRNGYRYGWNDLASRLRTIPADRVLGEGEEKIGKELLSAYEELWDMARIRCRPTTETQFGKQWKRIDALRANQGGTEG